MAKTPEKVRKPRAAKAPPPANPTRTTKTRLIYDIAQADNISRAEAAKRLNTFMSVLTENLSTQKSVVITGFGTFEPRVRKARVGKNSLTGQPDYQFAESRGVGFRAGKRLKQAMNATSE